jgi:predicted secreted protein
MGWKTGLAVYFVIWWIVIFMVLPWGVHTVGAEDIAKGHAPSAPKNPYLGRKLLATTVLAAVVWAIVYAVVEWGGLSFRQ